MSVIDFGPDHQAAAFPTPQASQKARSDPFQTIEKLKSEWARPRAYSLVSLF